jgi:hypothetical protein
LSRRSIKSASLSDRTQDREFLSQAFQDRHPAFSEPPQLLHNEKIRDVIDTIGKGAGDK